MNSFVEVFVYSHSVIVNWAILEVVTILQRCLLLQEPEAKLRVNINV